MKIFRKPIVLLMISTALCILIILAGYSQSWTGFGEFSSPDPQYQRAKTLWDWMQMLIIPIALAGWGTYWASASNRAERRIAEDRLREERLQSYLNQMGKIELSSGYSRVAYTTRARAIALARMQTLTILQGLDSPRKKIVLQYLHEAHLINRSDPIIDLNGADLSFTNLEYGHFDNANLQGVNLRHSILNLADLHEANLTNANLEFAVLRESDLSGATLENANLVQANMIQCKLQGALLANADMTKADLSAAILSNAEMERAELYSANLTDAVLEKTNLSAANLTKAILRRARLMSTQLDFAEMGGVDLQDAILENIELSDVQQRSIKSLKQAQIRKSPQTDQK